MSRFEALSTPIAGLRVVRRSPMTDDRGSFTRLFCDEALTTAGWSGSMRQANLSHTLARGTVRGMHFQHPPHAEIKYVTCLQGALWDVAVDLRRGSPTFLQSFGVELTPENHLGLVVPEGFAHGFQALGDDTLMLYFNSAPYAPSAEDGLNPLDPALGIAWPEPVQGLSPKDRDRHFLPSDFDGLAL